MVGESVKTICKVTNHKSSYNSVDSITHQSDDRLPALSVLDVNPSKPLFSCNS